VDAITECLPLPIIHPGVKKSHYGFIFSSMMDQSKLGVMVKMADFSRPIREVDKSAALNAP
jgi:hypothetical protein